MHYTVTVEVPKSYCHLCSIELHHMLRETFVVEEVIVQVATANVLKEEVYAVLILEDVVHAQHEWVIRLEQDLLLILRILDLLLIYEYVLVYALHCI